MTARLLTTLALALPLAACAAPPGPGQVAGRSTDAAPAAAAQATAPVVAEPAAAPAPARQTTQQTPPTTAPTAPAQAQPRAMAGTGAPSAAAPASAPAQTPAVQPDTTAPAVTAPPDVVAPRPAAPGATVPPVTMPAGSSTNSLLQTLFALILVLAVLGALAWFLKRYGPKVGGGNANLRVVGSLNLGGRERIVVVEVGNEWIVVGASPGRINALATMPRQDGQNGDNGGTNAALAPHGPAAHSFADWLKQTIDKRK
ncbi:flagellar biosynthetic protein FliO [Massilia sp.]|uniref:flagellar biosynthetic protein FliO n=1 Tax=Massilia sp. TaxID=1882437 RepID=UPI00352DC262